MANIFTIPASLPFADSLAKGLVSMSGGKPEILSSYRVLLPTRRACRTLRDAFLRQGNGAIMLLPKLEALGDPDEDELAIMSATSGGAFNESFDIPPAIHPMTRLALLAKLIRSDQHFDAGYAQSLKLATALMRFMDEMYIENRDWRDLDSLIESPDLAEHWAITTNFFKILSVEWPKILKERNVIDAMDRRNQLMQLQAKLWAEAPPQTPIIAAGITGSIPASEKLLQSILNLPQGQIILPALDHHLDAKSWDDLEEDHPQYTLKKLLGILGTPRTSVTLWDQLDTKGEPQREKLLSEVMRPATHTQKWRDKENKLHETSIHGLSLITCDNQSEESSVIALVMREALESDGQRCALVTPDRHLAIRVKEKLKRWGIEVDDSAGDKLTQTAQGAFLSLILDVIAQNFAPVATLALFKHRLCGNFHIKNHREIIRELDRVLRGPKPPSGFEGLILTIQKALSRLKRDPKIYDAIVPLLQILKPLSNLTQKKNAPLREWIQTHLEIAESFAATQDQDGAERLWAEESGEALANLFSSLLDQSHYFDALDLEGYQTLIDQLMRETTIRPLYGTHPRLFILGLLEARLFHADQMILAGLNEGSWPPEAKADPWMSRPMRKKYGLATPEQKIGFAAHDFAILAASKTVILTRSASVESVPQLPARWLQRLESVLTTNQLSLNNLSHYKYWAAQLDLHNDKAEPASRPAPQPPASARPNELFVTAIQAWMVDPYEIYAKYILGLRALDPLEAEQDAALKGTLIHDVLKDFADDNANAWPDEGASEILQMIMREKCLEIGIEDPEYLTWWPRFLALIEWLDAHEKSWRAQGAVPTVIEKEGSYTLKLDSGDFTIKAKADRIDRTREGYAVIDYKTGIAPSGTHVKLGWMPQLPLEALILRQAGFSDVKDQTPATSHLQYWRLVGDVSTVGKVTDIKPPKDEAINDLVQQAEDGLKKLVETFRDENIPFYSLPDETRKLPAQEYQNYAHLARVKEWANESEDAA